MTIDNIFKELGEIKTSASGAISFLGKLKSIEEVSKELRETQATAENALSFLKKLKLVENITLYDENNIGDKIAIIRNDKCVMRFQFLPTSEVVWMFCNRGTKAHVKGIFLNDADEEIPNYLRNLTAECLRSKEENSKREKCDSTTRN